MMGFMEITEFVQDGEFDVGWMTSTCLHITDMANIDMAESHDRNDFWKSAASAAENHGRHHAWLVVQNQIYVLTCFGPLKLFLATQNILEQYQPSPNDGFMALGLSHRFQWSDNDPSILHQSSTIVRYPQIFNHWLTINSPLEPTLNHYESLLINY